MRFPRLGLSPHPRLRPFWRRGAEARRRNAALEDENARLRTRLTLLCEATSDGLWDMELGPRKLMDPANTFLWSEQVRRLIRCGADGVMPSGLAHWLELLHPDDVAPTVAAFTAHILDRSGATPYDVTYRVRCGDGEMRWFRALGRAQRDAGGRAVRVAGALTDITDRRAILGLKHYAEAIIASLPTGLMVLDAGLAVLSLNRAFCDIVGLADEAEAAGLDLGRIVPQPGLREQAAAILAAGGIRHGIGVDLGARRLRLAMAGIQLAEGERRLLVMAEDVTAEQRLREEARAHAARYRDQASLLDKARDAIMVRGIDGCVQFWNKGAERLYGWSAADVTGRQVDAWLYRDGPAAATALVAATLEAGEWSGEIVQRRKDSVLLTVEGHWTLVRDDDNRPKCFLVINTDITQRKASDEKIRNLALYDTLTGLANRSLFTERLTVALGQARTGGSAGDPVHGPEPLQGNQRHPRPRGGRPGAGQGGAPPAGGAARRRSAGALGRRRVRGGGGTRRRPRRRRHRTAPDGGDGRPGCHSRAHVRGRPVARHRRLSARRRRHRQLAQARRHRHVPRQGGR
jgi:PAS domain S-box-containing protein